MKKDAIPQRGNSLSLAMTAAGSATSWYFSPLYMQLPLDKEDRLYWAEDGAVEEVEVRAHASVYHMYVCMYVCVVDVIVF